MNISIIITSRADYGPISNLIEKMEKDKKIKITVYVLMIDLKNNFLINKINNKIRYKKYDLGKSNLKISSHISKIVKILSNNIYKINTDLLVILGDRYELMSVPLIGLEKKIPVLHIAGGHITLGSFDESIRHSLTKLCHLHVASSRQNYKNIISLKEEKWRIKLAGSLGAENTKQLKLISEKKILHELGLDKNKDFIIITIHPTTHNNNIKKEMYILIKCLSKINTQFIITYPNNDPESKIIINLFKKFIRNINNNNKKKKKKGVFVKSLGNIRYLSLMKKCKFVIGNSSSAIIESPTFYTPVINLGDRQKGRIMSPNIKNCKFNENEIDNNIKTILDKKNMKNKKYINPYYMKNTSTNIIKFIKKIYDTKSIETIFSKKNRLIYD